MDPRDERRARNEILFREVNERIEEISEELHDQRTSAIFICECGQTDCHEKIELRRSEYEAIRANPTHFAVMPGHEDVKIARVVEEHSGYVVAEKLGQAATLAIEQDPRAIG